MRRSDREIKDIQDIIKVMEQCDVCRLALNDEGYPYILPLNFGLVIENEQIVLYFHGANEGRKYELIAKDNRVSFEMDCAHNLVTDKDKGSCTMEYKSVIGRGRIEIVPDDKKYDALCVLMKHYHKEDFPFNQAVIPRTTVLKLVVEQVTGKERMKKIQKQNYL
ncbi:MAG: pyridoxamine 5'-phosphate oxidase family protein [Lachnospiraceae bacterium]|nr:pyridoxamine 5'-phosphate oxidase family protein [Lachnospiraceae bacterium]